MSIWDDVKAAAGEAPKFPSRKDFETIYGYAKGQSLGTFPDAAAANKAGAATTEKSVDEDAYRAAQADYRAFNQRMLDEWMSRLRAVHSSVNDETFKLAYSLAYDRGHSSGYGEVELYLDDYIEFAEKVIAANK